MFENLCETIITNNGSTSLTLKVKLDLFPAGTAENPDDLLLDTPIDVEIEQNGIDCYTWTAPASGTLTVSASEGEMNAYFGMMVDNVGGSAQTTYSVDVTKGDVVSLEVITNDYSADTISFSATLDHTHSMTHHDAVAAGDHTTGMAEYWYCADCNCYFADAEGKYNVAAKSLTIPATGAEENPATGDVFSFATVAAEIVVSAMSVAAMVASKKKFF